MATPASYIHTKHFTYNHALASLALVKPIVADIMAKHERLSKLKKRFVDFQNSEYKLESEIQETEIGMRILAREIKYHLGELDQIGCLLKDPFKGLIDFPAIYNGQEVYLCWQFGEPTIIEYHGIYEGNVGRKQIPFDMIE